MKKRVCVVGGGAAGMAAAWSLSRYPDKFQVTLIEPCSVPGGVACTFSLPDGTPVNYGVQGGTPTSHQNTIEFMKEFGCEVGEARLDVSFGKDEYNWKNYGETSQLQKDLKDEINRFGRVMWWVSFFEFITIFLSIDTVLGLCRFSEDFRHRMVYPLVALFFGTGNQTPSVSAGVIARVFLDKSLALFAYDPERLVSEQPTNIAFNDLQSFYEKVAKKVEGAGGEGKEKNQCLFGTRVVGIERTGAKKGGVRVRVIKSGGEMKKERDHQWRAGGAQPNAGKDHLLTHHKLRMEGEEGEEERILEFDDIILACPADVGLRLLGDGAGFWEQQVLSSVEYFSDLTITHTDEKYMKEKNEVDDRAIYFIRSCPNKPDCLEMGFDLSGYQPELKKKNSSSDRVFQTIFLDQTRSDLWSIDEIDSTKILDRAWWSAFSHTYKHFRWVVPWVWAIQGRKNTYFAGSWTLFNTHDIANANLHADYQQDLINKNKMIQVKATKTNPAAHNPTSYVDQQQFLHLQQQQKDAEAAFLSVIRNCAETENIQGFVNEIHSVNLTENLCEKILRTLLDSRMKDEPLANFLHNLLVLKPLSLDKLSYALAACASSGSLCSIRLLVSQHNADVNYPYNSGQQWFLPLFAVLEDVDAPNMVEVAQLLLTLGGNPVKCSPDGMSALELLDLRFICSSGQPPPAALKIKDIFLSVQHSMVPQPAHYVASGVPHHAMVQGKRPRTHMPLSQPPHSFDEMHHDGMVSNTRLYLHCSEEEKETVKQLGARWDANRRQFYVPPGVSITPFEAWLPLQEWNGVPREERVYLMVPETDKDLVIQMGGQYDATHHRFFVPSGVSLQQFEPWLPKTENYGPPPTKRMKLDHLHG